MKVSVIIPIYQVEEYLEECLESVLRQTFTDYEVILVDDGSPDGCGAICDRYAARYPNFRVIHKENGGLSSARNAAMDLAAGDYLYFLDSDDTVDPGLLETVVEEMDRGADLVCFECRRLRPDGTTAPDRSILHGTFRPGQQRLEFLRDTLIPCKIGWGAPTRIFRREKCEEYGLRFADNRQIFAEDLYFSLCYCAHAEKIVSLDACLYNYRVREDSIMGVQQTRSNLGRISLLAGRVLAWYRRFDDCTLLVEHFDELYYPLIAGQFTYQMWASGIGLTEYRQMVRQEVTDWEFMENELRSYLRTHRGSRNLAAAELRANVLFLLGGSEFALRLRCKLIRMLKKQPNT